MKAVKTTAKGTAILTDDFPMSALKPGYLLIKVHAVALNPTDYNHVHGLGPAGSTIICDFAGEVVQIDETVQKCFHEGERVSGFVNGASSELSSGAFAEYLLAKADLVMRVPESMTYEEAATLGLGMFTCGQGLYQNMQLPLPNAHDGIPERTVKKPKILVYVGSTATGMLAIQLARLSGFGVLTTCSPRNFSLVQSLGAKKVCDYREPGCGAQIRRETQDELFYAYDCIGDETSARICAEALSDHSGSEIDKPKYGTVLVSSKQAREDLETSWSLVFSTLGEAFRVIKATGEVVFDCPAKPEDLEFAKEWTKIVEDLVAKGRLRPPPMDVRKGLEGIPEGIEESKFVSGKKLVYIVFETA